jgi:hypothetical protein
MDDKVNVLQCSIDIVRVRKIAPKKADPRFNRRKVYSIDGRGIEDSNSIAYVEKLFDKVRTHKTTTTEN